LPHVKNAIEGFIGCVARDVLEISVQEDFCPTEG
jgi:hypothetical protein